MERILEERPIESRPGVCGGKPCIAGTRIRIQDIFVLHQQFGKSAEEIVGIYTQLTLAEVHAALAYYSDHRAEIDNQVHEEKAFVERMKAEAGPGLLDRLKARGETNGDSLPS